MTMHLIRGRPATTTGANQPSSRGRPSKRRTTNHRRVRFMNRTSCRLYKKDLTDEEKRKVWYNAEEFQQIQKNTHADLRRVVSRHREKMMMKYSTATSASSEDGLEELNVRGLEHHLQGGPVNMKRQRRRRFVQYVLHTNKYMRVTNPEELRSYAVSLSHEDQYRAQRMAAYDAYEAYRVHREANFYRPAPSSMEDAHMNGNVVEAKMEAFQEFDNVPKPRIAARGRSDRSVVPPSA